MSHPITCTRHPFGATVNGRPMSRDEIELSRVRTALRCLLSGVYDQGKGPWSPDEYWGNRRRVDEARDVAGVYALAGELLFPHKWTPDDLDRAFAAP